MQEQERIIEVKFIKTTRCLENQGDCPLQALLAEIKLNERGLVELLHSPREHLFIDGRV